MSDDEMTEQDFDDWRIDIIRMVMRIKEPVGCVLMHLGERTADGKDVEVLFEHTSRVHPLVFAEMLEKEAATIREAAVLDPDSFMARPGGV